MSLNPSMLDVGRQRLQEMVTNRDATAATFARGDDLGRISILRDIVNDLPDSTEQNRLRYYISDLEDAVGQRNSISYDLTALLYADQSSLINKAASPMHFEPAYRQMLEIGGYPPDELLQKAFDLAISSAYKSELDRLPLQYRRFFPEDLDLTGAVSFGDKKDAIDNALWRSVDEARQQLNADTQDMVQRTLTSMEGYMPEFEKLFEPTLQTGVLPGSNPGYVGQHSGVTGGAGNQIGFSRFSEVETPLPGETSNSRGIYLHELQSDLLDDLREQGAPRSASAEDLQERMRQAAEIKDAKRAEIQNIETRIAQREQEMNALAERWGRGEVTEDTYQQLMRDLNASPVEGSERLDSLRREMRAANSKEITARDLLQNMSAMELDEAFPGMERNSKALQQLMIKNAVAAAVDNGYRFVALTSPKHSAQPQLYERIPQNARDVVKDLGEGFRVVDLTLEGNQGPFRTTAIVWGDDSAEGREAVNRILTRGVPFAEGGEVTSKPDDIKNLLSFLDK